MAKLVSIVKTEPVYPPPPFSPDESYPEYTFSDLSRTPNYVYRAIRNAFRLLRLDEERFCTKDWNPLGAVIKPGQRVLIKPNFVNSQHGTGGDLISVLTHGSIIRATVDYVIRALAGTGEIVIADSPERVADFGSICEFTGLNSILDFYNCRKTIIGNVKIVARDMRRENIKYWKGAIASRKTLEGDPEGYTRIRLEATDSAFSDIPHDRLKMMYGADYNRRETIKAHIGGYHEYEIPNTVLNSNVIISLPKLKTHYRVGTTLNCKGFVGLNGNKNLIPHRTLGDPSIGGDTYERPTHSIRGRLYRKLVDFLKDELMGRAENIYSAFIYVCILSAALKMLRPPKRDILYHGGCWYGNDTTWRSVVDITRIIHFSDKTGRLTPSMNRKFFSVVDGIIGGDLDGPMKTRMRRCGAVICGQDMVGVDAVATYLMGFNPIKVKYLAALISPHSSFDLSLNYPEDLLVNSDDEKYSRLFNLKRDDTLKFDPPLSWQGNGLELA
jgi:uncharacterized protein (DUF362 family)